MSESLETSAADDLASDIWNPDGVARYEDIFEGSGSGFMEFVFEQHAQADAGIGVVALSRS